MKKCTKFAVVTLMGAVTGCTYGTKVEVPIRTDMEITELLPQQVALGFLSEKNRFSTPPQNKELEDFLIYPPCELHRNGVVIGGRVAAYKQWSLATYKIKAILLQSPGGDWGRLDFHGTETHRPCTAFWLKRHADTPTPPIISRLIEGFVSLGVEYPSSRASNSAR